MTDLKMASAIRSSLLGKLSFDSVLKTKSLSYFVLHFGSLMAAQRSYESKEVETTQNQLVYSKLFNSYLEIAHMFGLGRVVADGLEPGWSWLTDYVKSVTSLDAITSRTGTNERYLASVVGEIDGGGGGGGGQDSCQPKWVTECDMELIQWSSEIPTDFQLGGKKDLI